MSERVTAEELKRVLVDGIVEYSEVSLEGFIARAADTIAALQLEAAAAKHASERTRDSRTQATARRRVMNLIERLNQIYDQDWRMGFLAHTSDTAGEAAREIASLRELVKELREALQARVEGEGGTATERHVIAKADKQLRGGDRPTHRHVKTGGLYEVLHDHAIVEADMSEAVIYRGHDGRIWIRPRDEFYDGRFEQLRGGE